MWRRILISAPHRALKGRRSELPGEKNLFDKLSGMCYAINTFLHPIGEIAYENGNEKGF